MRYLYFQPVSVLKSNTSLRTPHHHAIITHLQNCSRMDSLHQIHAQMIRTGLMQDTFHASRIISFLTSPPLPSDMDYARRVLDQIHHPNLFIWNSMIRGCTHSGAPQEAFVVYKLMLLRGFIPDSHTYTAITRACTLLDAIQTGKAVHGQVLKCGFVLDMYVMSGFISLYSKYGEVNIARVIFDEMPARDVVAWTLMVSGYAHWSRWDDALNLLEQMKAAGIEPNEITISSLLSACGQSRDLDKGHMVHNYAVENGIGFNSVAGNALVNMYAKCGSMFSAAEVFNNMPVKDTISWNVLIGGYVQNGLYEEALTMFHEMMDSNAVPDEITIVSALSACAQLGDIEQGKLLHDYIEEHHIICYVFVSNALVSMYSKCGYLETAKKIFLEIPQRDVFSWTAIISGYVQQNCFKEALALFQEMLHSYIEPNEVTLLCVLTACAQLGALDHGKQIHGYIEGNKVKKEISLENALLDMYAKCGCIEVALEIFHAMDQKDTITWNAMIDGLASHGHGREAIDLFNKMIKSGDERPNSVTLIAVLSACSHSGMVREGFNYFSSMTNLYGIDPGMEHYGCMVDLLGRAGLIDEAIQFIGEMPMNPNSVIWGSLLAACRVHRKMELGWQIALEIIKLAPGDGAAHVLISNLYAEADRWDDVRRVRDLMDNKGIEKSPGFSSIELNGEVHEFFVGDYENPQNDILHSVLEGLALHINKPGLC